MLEEYCTLAKLEMKLLENVLDNSSAFSFEKVNIEPSSAVNADTEESLKLLIKFLFEGAH